MHAVSFGTAAATYIGAMTCIGFATKKLIVTPIFHLTKRWRKDAAPPDTSSIVMNKKLYYVISTESAQITGVTYAPESVNKTSFACDALALQLLSRFQLANNYNEYMQIAPELLEELSEKAQSLWGTRREHAHASIGILSNTLQTVDTHCKVYASNPMGVFTAATANNWEAQKVCAILDIKNNDDYMQTAGLALYIGRTFFAPTNKIPEYLQYLQPIVPTSLPATQDKFYLSNPFQAVKEFIDGKRFENEYMLYDMDLGSYECRQLFLKQLPITLSIIARLIIFLKCTPAPISNAGKLVIEAAQKAIGPLGKKAHLTLPYIMRGKWACRSWQAARLLFIDPILFCITAGGVPKAPRDNNPPSQARSSRLTKELKLLGRIALNTTISFAISTLINSIITTPPQQT